MSTNTSRFIRVLLILFIAGYAAFFSVQLLLHYYSFGSRALDLGNHGQAIWNTAHGRLFHQTNQPGAISRLSLHVEPILIPISLLYYIYSGPEILFIFQSIVVALGAIPVFAMARLKLKSEWLALVFAAVYLMFPAIQGATLLDFHAVTLASTFLLAAFYYLETRRTGLFALFAVLAASCKEDMTLLVMMLGFYALFINRQYRLGITTVVLCAGWMVLAVFVIPPAFAGTENIHWNRYDHLGDTPLEIVVNMVTQPQLVIEHLREVEALTYLRLLLAPTAFTALFNPVTLLLALPSLGINLLSNFPPMQRVNSLIYAAPVVPAVIISSIYGVANLKRWLGWGMANGERPQSVANGKGQEANDATRNTQYAIRTTPHASRSRLFNLFIGAVVLGASLTYHAQYGFLPGGGQFRGWEEITAHRRRAGQIFAQIPPEAKLSAQDRLNPHVSRRETLYIFDRIDDADHVLLDVTLDSWPLHPVALRHRVDALLENGFGVVDAVDGYLLLAKDPNLPAQLPDQFYDFARVANPEVFTPEHPTKIVFDNKIELLGYSLELGAHEKFWPVATLYWRALEPLDEDYSLWPFFIDRDGRLIADPSERPLVATLWYPTSRWSPDEIIVTRTLPQELAPRIGDEFTLAVGVAREAWSEPAQRLPVTQADDLPTFEKNTWVRLNTFERTGHKSYQPVPDAAPPPQQPRQTVFLDVICLKGVDLPQKPVSPGERLPFTLHWQSEAPLNVDLTTFAHLLDQEQNVVAQLDWGPQDALGYLPTSAWQPQQPVVDHQAIPLPDDLAPGQYELVVGWYYAPTGERLPVTKNDTTGKSGDVVEIGKVIVR